MRRYALQRFAPGLEEHFCFKRFARSGDLFIVASQGLCLARELWIRLEEDETTFAEAAREFGRVRRRIGRVGPMPIGSLQPVLLQDILRGLKAGELSPRLHR